MLWFSSSTLVQTYSSLCSDEDYIFTQCKIIPSTSIIVSWPSLSIPFSNFKRKKCFQAVSDQICISLVGLIYSLAQSLGHTGIFRFSSHWEVQNKLPHLLLTKMCRTHFQIKSHQKVQNSFSEFLLTKGARDFGRGGNGYGGVCCSSGFSLVLVLALLWSWFSIQVFWFRYLRVQLFQVS